MTRCTWALLLFASFACSSSNNSDPVADAGLGETADAVDPGSARACIYVSPFTRGDECRQYGDSWTSEAIQADCEANAGNLAASCGTTYLLGSCALTDETNGDYLVRSYGEDGDCDLQKTGCETFGGGVWTDGPLCDEGGGGGGQVFIQPTLECKAPLAGEPVGQSANGEVCTWQAIAASTEEGRQFTDYASCEIVRTQRPYYPAQPASTVGAADDRLSNPTYAAELAWVTSQVKASACVCCHSSDAAPQGTSNWFLEAPSNWISSMGDTGVALGANAINSIAFGAFAPEVNNGFNRIDSGFPSTDPERMVQFFVDELTYRGLTPSDFAANPPFGGPLYDQIYYEPEACTSGIGVMQNGDVVWGDANIRYLYVLAADSLSPTAPPNLDTPDGTLWRVDMPSSSEALAPSSVQYGTVPSGMTQAFPEGGAPAALVTGTEYYLYASVDVGLPATRCTFVY